MSTQTTLSLDDSQASHRGPDASASRTIVGPHKEDICYATTNRQAAVKQVAPQVDAMIVVGSPNSSNSQRLREVAERSRRAGAAGAGARRHRLERFSRKSQVARHHGRAPPLPRFWSRKSWTLSRNVTRFPCRKRLRRRRKRVLPACPRSCGRSPDAQLSAPPARSKPSEGHGRIYGSRRRGADRLPRPPMNSASSLVLQRHRGGRREFQFLSACWTPAAFILTLYEKRVAEADLPFFLGLMEHLAAAGLTCPQPVRNRAGSGARPARGAPGGDRHLSRRLCASTTPTKRIAPRSAKRWRGCISPAKASGSARPNCALGGRLAPALRATGRPRRRDRAGASRALIADELDLPRARLAEGSCPPASSTPTFFRTMCCFWATGSRG